MVGITKSCGKEWRFSLRKNCGTQGELWEITEWWVRTENGGRNKELWERRDTVGNS